MQLHNRAKVRGQCETFLVGRVSSCCGSSDFSCSDIAHAARVDKDKVDRGATGDRGADREDEVCSGVRLASRSVRGEHNYKAQLSALSSRSATLKQMLRSMLTVLIPGLNNRLRTSLAVHGCMGFLWYWHWRG